MRRVYLDHNATSPPRPEALRAVQEVLENAWGNPSSVHWAGAAARAQVEAARAQVAALAGVEAGTLVFTSGATESNNAVIRSVAERASRDADTLLTPATEHTSVLETCDQLRARGLRIRTLPVDAAGCLDLDAFEAALDERVLLVSVMWVNNETGVVQPVPELARRARARGVPFHTDAAQALGKIPLDLARTDVDFASFSGHKLGAPKGVGALYVAPGRRLGVWLGGGGQERGARPGTENVSGIAGFGAVCEEARHGLVRVSERVGRLRDHLWSELQKRIPDVYRNGSAECCVAHVLNLSFPGAPADVLVEALDVEGIAVASGAACHAGSTEPSHVLLAMGLSPRRSESAIRLSLGPDTTPEDIDRVIEVLPAIVSRLREAQV